MNANKIGLKKPAKNKINKEGIVKTSKKIKHSVEHLNPIYKGMVIFIALIGLAFFLPSRPDALDVATVLGATAIFYSVLLGFYIASAMTNLARLKTLAASETGALIAIDKIVELSLPAKAKETKEKIDKYLVKRFQYEIGAYVEPTTKEFYSIFDVLKGAQAKSDGEGAAINYIAEAMYYIAQARREITIAGAKIMTSASWLLMIVLTLIIVICLFLTRDGSTVSAIIVSLLSSAAILSLFILDDIDGNKFGEEQFAIDTYQDVFSAMGLLHYYPVHILIGSRYKPSVKEYRTGEPSNMHIVQRKK